MMDAEGVLDYAELVHRSRILLDRPRGRRHPAPRDRLRLRRRVPGHRPGPGAAAADAGRLGRRRRGGGRPGPVDLRLPRRRGARHPRLPRPVPHAPTAPRPRCSRCSRPGGSGRPCWPPAAASRPGWASRGRCRPRCTRPSGTPEPDPTRPRGRVEVLTCTSAGAEAEHIAEILRAAHLRDGLAWEQMAVLVRSGRASIPPLTRALVAAGVPVEVAGDEIPLAADPAVRPLLLALQVATRSRRAGPGGGAAAAHLAARRPGHDGHPAAGPGAAPGGAGRAGRDGAAAAVARAAGAGACASPSCWPSATAVADAEAAAALADLLRRCEPGGGRRGTAEEVLWLLWSRTGWPERLRREAAYGGDTGPAGQPRPGRRVRPVRHRRPQRGGRRPPRGDRLPGRGGGPADPRRHPAGGRAARRRASGCSPRTGPRGWSGSSSWSPASRRARWPDVRRRGSLLEADRLGRRGRLRGRAHRAADRGGAAAVLRRLHPGPRAGWWSRPSPGRRGRATSRPGSWPSSGSRCSSCPVGRAGPLSLAALVGELRRVSVDPESPADAAGAGRRCGWPGSPTRAGADGRPLVPAADPTPWWGMRRADRRRPPRRRPRGARPAVRQPAGQRAGLPAAVVPGAAGARRARPQHRRELRLAGARAGRARGADATTPRSSPATSTRSGTSSTSTPTGCPPSSGWRPSRRWSGSPPGRRPRPASELLGTEVPFSCEVDARRRARAPHRDGRPGRAGPRRPGPHRRLQDLAGGAQPPPTSRCRTSWGSTSWPSRPARSPRWPAPAPARRAPSWSTCGSRTARPATRRSSSRPSLDDVPFPLGPARRPTTRTTRPPTWVHRRLAEAAEVIRSERFEARIGAACRYCPFRGSCPTQAAGQQVVA